MQCMRSLDRLTALRRVRSQTTVAEVKEIVSRKARNAPIERQRLIFRGRNLEDARTLQELGEQRAE